MATTLCGGGDGDDKLYGGSADDVLIGGLNGDRMNGGGGSDTFLFFVIEGTGGDLIFKLASEDVIDLSNIDADVTQDGNQAFQLVADFSGEAGQATLVYDANRNETTLLLDTDGDGAADGEIAIKGDKSDFSSFVL